jgi:hypothetical protein
MIPAFLLAASLALARAGDLPPAVAGYFDTQNNMDCVAYVSLFAADFTIQGNGVPADVTRTLQRYECPHPYRCTRERQHARTPFIARHHPRVIPMTPTPHPPPHLLPRSLCLLSSSTSPISPACVAIPTSSTLTMVRRPTRVRPSHDLARARRGVCGDAPDVFKDRARPH